MAYVITDSCTKDALCIDACTVDCIHPRQDEPDFEPAPMLFINPDECIDCGACIPVCPASAIYVLEDLPEDKAHFAALNAQHYLN